MFGARLLIFFLLFVKTLTAIIYVGDSPKIDLSASKYLMTYPEYCSNKNTSPYVFTINKHDQVLHYFGARHSFDPSHSQFLKLKKCWQSFLEQTKNKPRIVLVETRVDENIGRYKSENLVVYDKCESGFIQYLANKEKITVDCPEPSSKLITDLLLNNFAQQEVQYLYFARIAYQWNQLLIKPVFEDYISRFLAQDVRRHNWNGSLGNIKLIHRKLFNTAFNPRNKNFFYNITNPTHTKTIINQVSQRCSILRDVGIVNSIAQYWRMGVNIFVVYGSTHAVMQEPALQKALK